MSLTTNLWILWKNEKRLKEVEDFCKEVILDNHESDFDKGYRALASEILALIDMGPSA